MEKRFEKFVEYNYDELSFFLPMNVTLLVASIIIEIFNYSSLDVPIAIFITIFQALFLIIILNDLNKIERNVYWREIK